MSKEKQKQEAIKRMKRLKIMSQVINDFKRSDVVYYSEYQSSVFSAVLFYLRNKDEFVKIVKDFEKKTNCLVYHCQFANTEFGRCLSLLFVSNYEEDWNYENQLLEQGIAFAWVENLDDETCSEMGTIGIRPSMGGILRTA